MQGLVPRFLRCEYRIDPLGIDILAPRLSWIVESEQRQQKQTAYQILVADNLAALESDNGTLWNSGKVQTDQTAHVVYGGIELESHMRCYWKVRVWDRSDRRSSWSAVAFWTMGLLRADEWQAHWISHEAPYREIGQRQRTINPEDRKPLFIRVIPKPFRNVLKKIIGKLLIRAAGKLWALRVRRIKLVLPPSSYLRREFRCGRLRRGTIYVSALGLYAIYINRERVGNDCLMPGWTDYYRRIHYQTYDVTELLTEGQNVVGAILSDGWYSGYVGPWRIRNHYGVQPRLALQLHLEYEDGLREIIATDATWRGTTGPHLEADLLMGETYDAREELTGWSEPSYDESAWSPVDLEEPVDGRMQAMAHEPVRKLGEITPVEVSETRPDHHVFDMGQNFSGWVRLKVRGPAGTRITMRFAERLRADGTIYTDNLRSARATDTYILNGQGEEVWEPLFTYHGFQYVELSGYPGKPDKDAITGIVISSDLAVVGSFECSNAMVNRLYDNIFWTQRANFIEIPTDCPQRDERLGWLGDAQIFMRTATYNMDIAAFFTKWITDIRDAQSDQGAFPDLAPRLSFFHDGSPAWADAGIICPWSLYWIYGDTRIIEQHYDAMKKWVAYILEGNPDLLWKSRTGNNNGEWLPIDPGTPKEVLATAYFAYSTHLLAGMAAAVGQTKDAETYATLSSNIKQAFNKAFVSPDGRIKGETQTCYLLALRFGLLSDERREQASRLLVNDIRRRDGHLTTGFFGTGYLAPELTAIGHTDIAYQLLTNETYPSWGYSIRQSATSIWERWDGWSEENGFRDPLMNSFSHYGFGSIGEWLFSTVAGIDTDGPGFRSIVIRPQPGGGIEYVKAYYESINGRIVISWNLEKGRFFLDVTIPANTNATVFLPTRRVESVTESHQPISQVEGVNVAEVRERELVLQVGSGRYLFAVDEA